MGTAEVGRNCWGLRLGLLVAAVLPPCCCPYPPPQTPHTPQTTHVAPRSLKPPSPGLDQYCWGQVPPTAHALAASRSAAASSGERGCRQEEGGRGRWPQLSACVLQYGCRAFDTHGSHGGCLGVCKRGATKPASSQASAAWQTLTHHLFALLCDGWQARPRRRGSGCGMGWWDRGQRGGGRGKGWSCWEAGEGARSNSVVRRRMLHRQAAAQPAHSAAWCSRPAPAACASCAACCWLTASGSCGGGAGAGVWVWGRRRCPSHGGKRQGNQLHKDLAWPGVLYREKVASECSTHLAVGQHGCSAECCMACSALSQKSNAN